MRAKEFLSEGSGYHHRAEIEKRQSPERTAQIERNNSQIQALLSKLKLVPLLQHPVTKKPIYVYDNDGRYTVLVDIGSIRFPFYRSTGLGGKATVEPDKWYPFFGIGPGSAGWMNKGSEKEINNYYGSSQLKSIADILNSTYTNPTRNFDTVAGWNGLLNSPEDEAQFVNTINQGISPATRDDDKGYLKNKANMLAKLNVKPVEPIKKDEPKAPTQPTSAYGDKSLPDGKFMLGGIAGQVMNNSPVGPITKYMFDLIRREVDEKQSSIAIGRELTKYLDSAKLPTNIKVNDLVRKFGSYSSDYKRLKDKNAS